MSTKKEKKEQEKLVKKMKAQQEDYEKQKKQYKDKVRPMVKFLRRNKLPFNNAHVGNERVEYFRLDDFEKLLKDKAEELQKNEELKQLTKKAYSEFIFFKRPDTVKTKYPKTLQPVESSSADKKYASFRFDTTESKKRMTIFAVMLVLILVLFPIWPFSVKYGLWLVSLSLLIVIVGIIVVRLIVYVICAIFNYHVWIFPDLLYANGVIQCFVPVIEVIKGDRSWFNIFIRLFAISFFMLCCMHIYLNPTFFDETLESTKATIADVHDWGVGKIKNEGNFSQRALTNLDTILNETANIEEISNQKSEDHEEQINQEDEEQEESIIVDEKTTDDIQTDEEELEDLEPLGTENEL